MAHGQGFIHIKIIQWKFLKRETGFQRKQKVLLKEGWSLENGLFSEFLLITISIVCKYQEYLSSEFLLYFCCITISIIIFVLRMAVPQNCSCINISIICKYQEWPFPSCCSISISIICKYQEWPFLRVLAVLLSVSVLFVSIKNGLSSEFWLYYYQYQYYL